MQKYGSYRLSLMLSSWNLAEESSMDGLAYLLLVGQAPPQEAFTRWRGVQWLGHSMELGHFSMNPMLDSHFMDE